MSTSLHNISAVQTHINTVHALWCFHCQATVEMKHLHSYPARLLLRTNAYIIVFTANPTRPQYSTYRHKRIFGL